MLAVARAGVHLRGLLPHLQPSLREARQLRGDLLDRNLNLEEHGEHGSSQTPSQRPEDTVCSKYTTSCIFMKVQTQKPFQSRESRQRFRAPLPAECTARAGRGLGVVVAQEVLQAALLELEVVALLLPLLALVAQLLQRLAGERCAEQKVPDDAKQSHTRGHDYVLREFLTTEYM